MGVDRRTCCQMSSTAWLTSCYHSRVFLACVKCHKTNELYVACDVTRYTKSSQLIKILNKCTRPSFDYPQSWGVCVLVWGNCISILCVRHVRGQENIECCAWLRSLESKHSTATCQAWSGQLCVFLLTFCLFTLHRFTSPSHLWAPLTPEVCVLVWDNCISILCVLTCDCPPCPFSPLTPSSCWAGTSRPGH